MSSNMLVANAGKTVLLVNRPKFCKAETPQITLAGETITEVDSTRVLGFTMSRDLTWKEHISTIKKKICQGTNIMQRLRTTFPKANLKPVLDALILSSVRYGLELFGPISLIRK